MSQAMPPVLGATRFNRLLSPFNNLKIATKIATGFAIILAITAAISAMAYSSFVKVEHGFESFNQRVLVAVSYTHLTLPTIYSV